VFQFQMDKLSARIMGKNYSGIEMCGMQALDTARHPIVSIS